MKIDIQLEPNVISCITQGIYNYYQDLFVKNPNRTSFNKSLKQCEDEFKEEGFLWSAFKKVSNVYTEVDEHYHCQDTVFEIPNGIFVKVEENYISFYDDEDEDHEKIITRVYPKEKTMIVYE